MEKIYQPVVRERSEKLIEVLDKSGFFKDYEIQDKSFAREYFMEKLTDKFIIGELDIENDSLFTEDEFDKYLREIIVGSILEELKNKGVVNSYEDDTKGEMFFITDKGRDFVKNTNLNQKFS